MKKNKGFTLIELLAVIVVLAIIALIATPIVMNTIKNTKKGATERSADSYVRQVETALMEYRMKNGKEVPNGEYIISSDGNLCLNETCDDKLIIEMNGTKANNGKVVVENSQVVLLGTRMEIGEEYVVSYDESKESFVATEKNDESILPENTLCKHEDGVDLTNLVYGNKFTCEVSDAESQIFYVLEITSDNVSLIMDRNLTNENVAWGTEKNEEIPVVALEHLNNNTTSWTKIDQSQISLPTGKQVTLASGEKDWAGEWTGYELASWLSDNSDSYWLYDTAGDGYAWYYSADDRRLYQDHVGIKLGVRPVITIPKTQLS